MIIATLVFGYLISGATQTEGSQNPKLATIAELKIDSPILAWNVTNKELHILRHDKLEVFDLPTMKLLRSQMVQIPVKYICGDFLSNGNQEAGWLVWNGSGEIAFYNPKEVWTDSLERVALDGIRVGRNGQFAIVHKNGQADIRSLSGKSICSFILPDKPREPKLDISSKFCIAFSKQATKVYSFYRSEYQLKEWNIETTKSKEMPSEVIKSKKICQHFAMSPDEKAAAISTDAAVSVFDPANGDLIASTKVTEAISVLAMSNTRIAYSFPFPFDKWPNKDKGLCGTVVVFDFKLKKQVYQGDIAPYIDEIVFGTDELIFARSGNRILKLSLK
jgi:hypothetical protein